MLSSIFPFLNGFDDQSFSVIVNCTHHACTSHAGLSEVKTTQNDDEINVDIAFDLRIVCQMGLS